VAGGGVHYSDAAAALRALAEQTGIPVAETQAGKGALPACSTAPPAAGEPAARPRRHSARSA
jgi:3D-(3,5/4)-trihydroxycyclohexane-1,2-dione acylhydrolase (decyclizing)